MIVLWRKLCPFKLVDQKAVTSNCLAVQLKSASNQELEIVFVRNPNDEKDKISNLSKAFEHLAENGSKNQIIIKDFNTSLNTELDYVGYTQDPHKASREFLHGLQDDGIFIDVYLTQAWEDRTRSLDSVREEPVILLQLSLYSQYPTATSEAIRSSRLAQVLGEPSTNLVYMDAQVLSIRKKEEISY